MPTFWKSQETVDNVSVSVTQLLTYSLDKGSQQFNKTQIRLYKPHLSKDPINLSSIDYDNSCEADEHPFEIPTEDSLTYLLNALMHYEKKEGKAVTDLDILAPERAFRRLLTNIYTRKKLYEIHVVWFDGQLFLQQNKNVQPVKHGISSYREAGISRWKLSQFLTRSPYDSKARLDKNSGYFVVAKTVIGKTKLLSYSRVDTVTKQTVSINSTEQLTDYVNIRSFKLITNSNLERWFDRILMGKWASMILHGSNKVVYGFEGEQNSIEDIREFSISDILKLIEVSNATRKNDKWNSKVCLSFFNSFLEWLKKEVPQNETKAWSLRPGSASSSLTLNELQGVAAENALKMIPADFINWRKSLRDANTAGSKNVSLKV